jgi:RNA polymerase sigma factor (sigma-70 family)
MLNADSLAATTIHNTTPQTYMENEIPVLETKGRLKALFSNEAILAGLKDRDKDVIKYIYRNNFQQIRHMILSNSGTAMDAEDVFQDAMLIIYQKTGSGLSELSCSFTTFLYAICRNIWFHRLEHKGKQPLIRDISELESVAESHNQDSIMLENEQFRLFHHHFEKLSESDRKVLNLFMKKVPLKEIARIMGYKSVAYAKVRKYLTKEKLKNSILSDPSYQEILRNGQLSPVFNS